MPKDKFILIRFVNEFVDLMRMANPSLKPMVRMKNGKNVLYLRVIKDLYGCNESGLLWYQIFRDKLKADGFELNPYDKYKANKTIDGTQCTITWFVDDVKISHANKDLVAKVINGMECTFEKLTVNRGKKHRLFRYEHID